MAIDDRFSFRAWHPEWSEMVYSVTNSRQFEKRSFASVVFDVGFSYYPKDDGWELMQSIGIRDCNGKLIFEGDIVKDKKGNIGRIVYLQQECGYVVALPTIDYRLGHRNHGSAYDADADLEVIGNIRENPELLPV